MVALFLRHLHLQSNIALCKNVEYLENILMLVIAIPNLMYWTTGRLQFDSIANRNRHPTFDHCEY